IAAPFRGCCRHQSSNAVADTVSAELATAQCIGLRAFFVVDAEARTPPAELPRQVVPHRSRCTDLAESLRKDRERAGDDHRPFFSAPQIVLENVRLQSHAVSGSAEVTTTRR